jgi:hypothetical protein
LYPGGGSKLLLGAAAFNLPGIDDGDDVLAKSDE